MRREWSDRRRELAAERLRNRQRREVRVLMECETLIEAMSLRGRMVIELDFWNERPAEIPTRAKPGTPEKIAVMRYRLSQGQALYHPEDGSDHD